jgi:lysophospholipase L1-like esterase
MASFSQLFVFGDSASDYGSLAALLRQQSSPRGRYSGVTAHNTANNWQILLRRRLSLPMPGDPLAGGFRLANRYIAPHRLSLLRDPSFAVSGATSGLEHLEESGDADRPPMVIAALQNRGLQGQLEAALHQGIRPTSRDLTIIWGGANDLLLGVRQERQPDQVVAQTVKQMLANVEVMLRSGEARQIVASTLVPLQGQVNGVAYQLPYISRLLRQAGRKGASANLRAWADYFRSDGSAELLEAFDQGLEELRAKYPYAAIVGFRNEFETAWQQFGQELGDFSSYGIVNTQQAAQSSADFATFTPQQIASFLHFDNVHFSESGNQLLARSLELTLSSNQASFAAATLTHRIRGTSQNDQLRGSSTNDHIIGGLGNDQLWGVAGNNLLEGGAGNDLLIAGTGNDLLIGGPGADRMHSGSGATVFAWRPGDLKRRPLDVVEFFNGLNGDRLAINNLLDQNKPFANPGWQFIGSGRFSRRPGELRFQGGVLLGDVSGNGSADLRVQLPGVNGFSTDWIS